MGSWYDYLKKIRKPDYITIRRGEKGVIVILQYHTKHGIGQKILELEEVSIHTKDLECLVQKGERWGDWGGAIKTGDIITVGKV